MTESSVNPHAHQSECHKPFPQLGAKVPLLGGIESLLKADENTFHALEFSNGLLFQIVVEADCRLFPRIPCAEDFVLCKAWKGFRLDVEPLLSGLTIEKAKYYH